jgi:hypothetical protein
MPTFLLNEKKYLRESQLGPCFARDFTPVNSNQQRKPVLL